MSKIHILADSSADLTLEEAEKYQIRVLPFRLCFENGEEYRDRIDITTEAFYKKIRTTGMIPKTVQITPAEFEEIFREEAAAGYEELVVVTIASAASGTYQSAVLAKEIVEGEGLIQIHLVDSMNLAHGTGYAAIKGAEVLAAGGTAEQVAQRIQEVLANMQTYFVVETLDYLKKGGRIRTATAIIGGMLDIRPILYIKDGMVESYDKVRGEKKVNPKFISILKEKITDFENCTLMIFEGDAAEKAKILAEQIEAETGKKVDVFHDVGPIIGSHSGTGVLGVCFITKKF